MRLRHLQRLRALSIPPFHVLGETASVATASLRYVANPNRRRLSLLSGWLSGQRPGQIGGEANRFVATRVVATGPTSPVALS